MRSPFRRTRIRIEPLSPWRRHDPAWMLLGPSAGAAMQQRRGMAGSSSAAPSPAAAAIAQAEGYGAPNAVPTIANNPGDLVLGDIGYGVTGAAGGVQITNFPNAAAGYAALQNQINAIAGGTSTVYPAGATIAQVSNIYSGSTSGAWGNNVASILGVTTDTPFSAIATPGSSASASPASTFDGSTTPDATTLTDSSLSDLLDGITASSDNTPYYVAAGIAAFATLALAIS